MSDEQVLVREFQDEQEASVFIELLASEGITASAPGLAHRGMLGVVGGYISVPVRVSSADAERARELLTLFQTEVESLYDGDQPATYRDAPARQLPDTPRRPLVARFAAFVFPLGGGHFYTRSYPTAWLLLWLACLGYYSLANSAVPEVFHMLPLAIVVFDMLAVGYAVRSFNEQKPRSAFVQVAIALPAVFVLAQVLLMLGHLIDGE